MPLVRMLCSWGLLADPVADRMSNTLYFNVSGGGPGTDPDYQALASDLGAIYMARSWCAGMQVQIRAYNMDDAKPRPERAYYVNLAGGTAKNVPRQIAVALSYYADRNLPRRRGRIFTGPWTLNESLVPNSIITELNTFQQALAGLGGLNVDWSVYSPTDDAHYRISNAWVDNSWDVIRSRKLPATGRTAWSLNG